MNGPAAELEYVQAPNGRRPDSESPQITVLIIDDHPMVAEGLAAMLESLQDISVVGIERTCAGGVAAAARLRPVLVLLEQQLSDGPGTGALAAFFADQPDVIVLMVTADDSDEVLAQAFRGGAAGVISKKDRASVLITAIRAAAGGEPVITPGNLRRLLPYLAAAGSRIGGDLTERERDVLRLLVKGTSTSMLAATLFVAPATARNHIQSIITKLGAHSRLEAVSIALREDILSPVA